MTQWMTLPGSCVAYEDFVYRAREVLPKPVFTYLESGIGREKALQRNRLGLDAVTLTPRANGESGMATPDTVLCDTKWQFPFGVAPVGVPGLFCPGAEVAYASACSELGIPFVLSTVASATIEEIAAIGGSSTWFQLYPIRSSEIRNDLIERAGRSGCETLVVTVDVPMDQRRERTMRSGLGFPVRPWPLARSLPLHPRWVLRMLRGPRPVLRNLEVYQGDESDGEFLQRLFSQIHQPVDSRLLENIRNRWPGKLVVKGVLDSRTAADMVNAGVDALVVSNHGGRQLDAAPSPVQALPGIRKAVGQEIPILVDSGASSGLDILRLLRVGADFVLLGRYPYMAASAYGAKAAKPALDIICHQITTVMVQLGIRKLVELADLKAEVVYEDTKKL